MSEYAERKAIALENQRKKEAQLKRELEEKQQKERQRLKDEAERARMRDAAAKEARRLELQRANEALNKAKDAKNGNEEWNPFAEDELPAVTQSTATAKSLQSVKKPNGATSTPRAGPSKPRETKPSGSGSGTPNRKRETSPVNMSRKDKAKRSFAIAAKKSEKDASIFSIRDMVEAKSGPPPGILAARDAAPWRGPTHTANGHAMPRMGAGSLHGKNGSAGGIKGQIKAGFKAEPMRKLCPDRDSRDKRSIDEIQRDIRAAKKAKEPESSMTKNGASTPPTPARKPKPKPPPLPSSARPAPTAAPIPPSRRQRSPSEASASSYESDRPRKRRREDEREMLERASVSAQIQAMFRRPGAAPKRYDDYSDDDSDMEAGLDDVEEEDRRAAAIARREDRLAEEEEKARKLAKEKAKRERMKGK